MQEPSHQNDPPSENPINWEFLHQLSDGDTEFQMELLDVFVTDTQSNLDLIKTAIAAQDCRGVEQSAHRIKGASGSLGITAMQSVAATLEDQARDQQLTDAIELLSRLEWLLQTVEAAGSLAS
ncbi:hypothetical protein DO97_06000 [Neosynechococcus sphagnicola sy1]|uniref:HPt domain-containing protein n=1 Tax=Neosynechococcus sphagnicola sy1 TaxID=1497020 RepID=A0A098TNJ4_9CYAN|nr:hypothetical protein DO97_06000 [Neosynechococcus sphagnicola sy1]